MLSRLFASSATRFFAAAIFGLLSTGSALAQQSAQSDIIPTSGYTYPTDIAYNTSQENSNIVNSTTSKLVAGFRVRDGGAGNDSDNDDTILTGLTFDLGSNWSVLRRIELWDATGTTAALTSSGTNEQFVTGQTVVFTGLSLQANDNGGTNFQVRVSFNDPVTDNVQFSFTVTAATCTTGAGFSTFAAGDAGAAVSSTAGDNNRIEVTATKALFVQGPSNVTVNAAMTPSVTIEAVDNLDNRDLDNGSTLTLTSNGTPAAQGTAIASSGLATFAAITHTATANNRTLSAVGATPTLTTTGASSTFNIVTNSAASDIIANTGFTYTSNIAYDTYQETDITVASLQVAKFDVRDGGVGANDGDVLPTVLTDITFNLTNFANIRRMALYAADGTTELAEVAVSSGTVTFTGLTISAADNGATSFFVLASFNNPVTDNQQFRLTVTSATAQAANSVFNAANAGGAATSITGDINRIEILATHLRFVAQPSNTFIGFNMTAVTVETVDVLNNRDVDNTSQISITSPAGTLTGTPVQVNAVAGLATFSTLVHTAGGTGLTLSADATTPLSTVVSSTFNIRGSDIITNAGFTPTSNIPYINFQEPTNLSNANSIAVAGFDIRDGGGVVDPDALPTIMSSVTLDLGANFSLIRRIALYTTAVSNTEIGTEQAPNGASQTVVFSGLSGTNVTANDGLTAKSFFVRVSFMNTVTDNTQFSITISATTTPGGTSSPMQFANAGGAVSPTTLNQNRIAVSATKLLFVQQPSNVVANAAMADVTIKAADALNNQDTDNTSNVTVTSTGTPAAQGSVLAAGGLATFSAITHTVSGTGLTLSAVGASPSLTTTGASSTFNVTGTSDIIANVGFTYTADIAYGSYQETDITVASLPVAKFDIQDGAGSSDADALPTVLTDISFGLTNFANIRQMALYAADGTTELAEVAVSSGTVTFTGLNISAADNGSTSFIVLASFKSVVTDKQQFRLTVNSATALAANSQFVATNAGGAQSSISGTNNTIQVTATKILFLQQPSDVFVNENMTPAVTIQAVDALNNKDLDNTSTVSVTSSGTLTGTTVNAGVVVGTGIATFATLQHSVTGTGLTLTAAAATPSLTGVVSSTFNVAGGSDIITNAGFTPTSNIAYNNFQEASDIVVSGTSIVAAKFDIRDGGGGADPDVLPTILSSVTLDLGSNFSLIRRVALYNAAGTTEIGTEQAPVGLSQTVAFTGLSGPNVTAADGLVATSFFVRVSFMNTVTDNTQFSIAISATTTPGGTSSGMAVANAGGAVSPTTLDQNRIEVLATKLLFVQGPSNVEANASMAPDVTIKAADPLDNRDLDNGSSVAVTSNGILAGTPVTVTALNGLATFSSLTHTVAAAGRALTATAATPPLTTTGASSTFNVTGTSDIIANSGFSYTADIAYQNYQETDITVASLPIAKFDIQDGAGSSDADGLPTVLTDISFGVTNFANINRMAIYAADGTTELAEVAVTTGTVTFTGLSISAADNASTSFIVLASFKSAVTDKQQFQLTVNSATAQAANSQFIATNAGGAQSSISGTNNTIQVTATKLLFVQQPTIVFINVNMSPAVTVKTVDALDNLDLDNASTVSITSSGTLTGTTVNAGVVLGTGIATFATLQHSVAGIGRTLTAAAATPTLTSVGSSTFTVVGGSDIIANAGFTPPSNIAYISNQEASNITNAAGSIVVAAFDIRDGGSLVDPDGLPTILSSVTLDLGANFSLIRRIALFTTAGGNTQIGTELAPVGLSQTVAFTGLSGPNVTAADGLTPTSFFVRVSFMNNVTDNTQFSIAISATTTPGGTSSTMGAANAGGAVTPTTSDQNRIEVTATKLLFAQQPPAVVFQGGAMNPAVTVAAVDANDIQDLDNASSVIMASTGTPAAQGTVGAINGLATFPAIIHTVQANGLFLSATSTGPTLTTTGNSSSFNVVAPGSDITANSGFVYPTDIAYDTYQAAANIVNSTTSLVVAKFDIRDGSGTADADGTPTTMTNLTLDLGLNYGLIRRIALYDGTGATELTGTNEQAVSTQTVAFSGLSFAAPDDGTNSFTVRVSFQDPVTDNQQFSLTITAGTATGSGFSSSIVGVTTSVAGNNNRIEVLATKMVWVTGPSDAYINVAMAPSVTIQTLDALDNLDLDNVSSISITSTGNLTGTPVAAGVVLGTGVATFSTLAHSLPGTALTLAATSTGPILTPPGSSTTFDIFPPSNASDIILNTGFTHPPNIAYETFQEASDITNSATSIVAAKFDIRDGGGAADGDAFPTVLQNLTLDLGSNYTFIRKIALYDAAGTTELTGVNEQLVGGSPFIGFSGLSITAPDGGSISFTVRVSFTTAVVDNQQFSFTVNSTATLGTNSSMAATNAGAAVTPTGAIGVVDDNRIEVTATKLLFVQQPTSTFAGSDMTPAVTIEAVDANNKRDLDNGSDVAVTSTGTLTGTPVHATASNGLASFAPLSPTALVHTAPGAGLTLSATAVTPSLTGVGPSNTFGVSNGSDIVADPAFTYPSNIAYNTFQAPNILNSGTSLIVAKFILRDGGVAPVDPDLVATTLINLTLNLGPNFALIRKIALYDAAGTTEFAEQAVGGPVVNFPGLGIAAPDDLTTAFTVRVSFNAPVTDNLQFSLTVSAAISAGSAFAAGDAGAATTSIASDDNRVEVTATKLLFAQQPSDTYLNVGMTPSVTVESVDALNSRDLDNASTISLTSTGTLTGTPVVVGATNGLATFPLLAHSVAQTLRTLSATAATPTLTASPASSTFTILPPSNTSDIVLNGTSPLNIAYNNFQEATDIVVSGTSLNVAKFDVRDGGPAADGDAFPTTLTNLTLDLGPNFGVIRRIALYDAAGTAELPGTVNEQAVGAQLVAFTGLTITAPDNGSITFTVRVSFQDPVTDNLQFSVAVNTTATVAINSSFNVPSAGGAVTATGAIGVVDQNRIEVTATKLLFVQGPTNAFINVAMTPSVTVEAVDALDNRDLDNTSNVSITSTGTLTGTPVVIAAINGLATFPGLAHSVAQTLRTIAATSTAPVLTTTGNSATFSILAPSNASNIILDGSFTHPPNIAYISIQENANIINSTSSLVVGRFIVQDGGGASDADAFPTVMTSLTLDLGTNFGLINRIALYDAAGTGELPAGTNEQVVAGQTVTFTGLTITAPDNGNITFTVRVSFKSSVTDNLQFSVLVSNTATLAINSSFNVPSAGGAVTPTGALGVVDANRIEVTATLLRFTQNLTSPLLPAKDISAQQAVPVARAEDALVNVDADYATNATITCALTVTPSSFITPVGGVFTFPSNFRYVETGNGTITLNAAGLTGVISNPVVVQAGVATTITAGAAPPGTIPSLNNTAPGLPVFNFIVNDDPGGTAANNDDGLPTLITQIVITQNTTNNNIADWTQAINSAQLSDGTNTLNATAITATSITFGGISTIPAPPGLGYIVDNGSKTYTLSISIKQILGGTLPVDIDGRKFEFQVLDTDVTLATSGSTKIIGGEQETTGSANAVAVDATTLRFTSPTGPPIPVTVSLDTDFPGITTEAVDGNNNRDLNYVSAITELTNVAAASMSPNIVGNLFVAGLYTFPTNFRFTSGASGANVTLSIKAGASTVCGPTTQCATSVALTLLSSSESSIVGDPTYNYNVQLPYVQHQATDIDITTAPLAATSIEVARFLLIDGNRTNFNYGGFLVTTGTAVDGTGQGDDDGADTRLTSVTIRVTNPATLRRLAIYNGTTELGEIDVDALNIVDGTPFQDFVFNGAPLLVAPDNNLVLANGIVPISVRVSFLNAAPVITDGDFINVSVSAASLTTGSTFFNDPAFIAGVSGGTQSSPGFNRLNVTATKLDFVAQPAATAGKNEPVVAATVHARDQFNVLDTDFNFPASVTSQGAATVLGSFSFTNGVLNMNGLLTYGNAGVGTLTVTAGPPLPAPQLSSLTNQPGATPPNVAVQCSRVDVIHVGTTRQDGGPGGVPNGGALDQVSVLAGTQDQVIFGFGFNAPHGFAGDPKVTKFSFSLNNSYSGIIANPNISIRVFENTGSNQFIGSTQVNPSLVTLPNTQTITVDFTASPRDLIAFPNLTYFLMVDIDPNVGGTTPNLKAGIVDGGVGSLTQNNILVQGNVGSQLSNTSGPTINFASVAPPTLVDTYPRIGQTNVDPAQPTIEMTFSVPVFTLDQKVYLYKKSGIAGVPDVLVVPTGLPAANGFPFVANGVGAKPIIFNIPVALDPDGEYYVLVAQGNLSTNTGLTDASRNLFPGINYPGTFFFRTGNTGAPKLLGSGTTPIASAGEPSATDITNGGATINATFDKLGKAYYIVASSNVGLPPTNTEIINTINGVPGGYTANPVVGKGQFAINATHSISQFGNFSVPGGFAAGTHYVWITAESNTEKKVAGVITTTSYLAAAPYGSTAFNFGTISGSVTGPTFNFFAPGPGATPIVSTNNTTISLCSNSFQILNNPIIIYEGTNPGQTFQSPSPDQTLNLVLPAGFQFDDSEDALGKPLYATVDLIGGDFLANSQNAVFLSTSVLRITFTNTGNSTLDQIVLRNIRIRSDGSRVGNIFRLGGTGIPAINDGAIIARLSAQEASPINFDNSYSESLGQTWSATGFSETAVPDNALPSLVTLTPYIPNSYDFGPTTFTGQGININTLNVNGVTKDVPFNITVLHKDQNGCISDNPIQFVVYDNTRAVIVTNPSYPFSDQFTAAPNPANIPLKLDQGPYCTSIPEFRINKQNASGAGVSVIRDVTYDNLNAYYMESLVAAIPAGTPATTIINPVSFGGAWNTVVADLPLQGASHLISGRTYYDYSFDDRKIINAHAISAGYPAGQQIPYLYDIFKQVRPISPNYANGITYYDGGSLGFVEFTGTFRNIANPVVQIKRRQIVQFYVPAVPAIEFTTPYSDLITNDPGNAPSSTIAPLPNPNFNNPGTLIFCEGGGLITVTGYPKPDPTAGSKGFFRIYNASSGGAQVMTGLNDFLTGTAQIDPTDAGIKNANANIRIEYVYQDGVGNPGNQTSYVCATIASQVIRITPNPLAAFTRVSLPSPNVDPSNLTAYCQTKPITFDPSTSTVGGGAIIETYSWDFDDATDAVSSNPNTVSGLAVGLAVPGSAGPPVVPPNPAAGTNKFPVHYYLQARTYNPTLTIISDFNCASAPATLPTIVGGIPVVKARVDGTHAGATVADEFHFQSNNSTVSSNDAIAALQWTFGDASSPQTVTGQGSDAAFNAFIKPHNYSVTGQVVYDLKVTSGIGCVNSLFLTNQASGISVLDNNLMRTLVVLPRFVVTAANAYLETFEPAGFDPTRVWQPWYTGAFQPAPVAPATTPARSVDPTWVKGVPGGAAPGKFGPTVNGANIWVTGLTGTYSPFERSALYSPSFDMSALLRPMISFDTYTQMGNADGVVLQYSVDNKNITDPTKVWKVLGTNVDGENWYPYVGIAAKPGDQVGGDYGWSQGNNLNDVPTWLSSRHALTEVVSGLPVIITNPRLVFRIALASASSSPAPGFGFDNVRLGERTRTILLETFSNTSNTTQSSTTPSGTDEEYENTYIQQFNSATVGLEVVKLNYHVNFPGNDPFNKVNPADPSSRALFYSVSKTPASRLDGYAPAPYEPFSAWGQNTFDTRTLRLAQADITIRPTMGGAPSNITSSGKITFMVDVSPTVDLDKKTVLHVGIVEQNVPVASLSDPSMVKTGENQFEYVVKKLLPTASGTRTSIKGDALGVLKAPVFPAGPIVYSFGPFEWDPILSNFYAPNTGDLGIIAFLQREDGDREVYQAEIVLSLDDPPSGLVTGVEPIRAEQVLVYPNPANHEMTVQMPGVLASPARLSLIDQTGRETLTGSIPEGADRKALNVRDLSSGVYILTIDMGQGVITRKKVMVVHQD